MLNPYEPPLSSVVAVSSPTIVVPTRSQRVRAAFMLAIGCVVGLNVSAAVDEGIESAIRRTTIDPIAALSFFAAVAVVCTLIIWVWALIRRQVRANYYAPAPVQFVAGVLLTFSAYQILMYAERTGVDFLAAVSTSLFATTVGVVEGEAFITKALCQERR